MFNEITVRKFEALWVAGPSQTQGVPHKPAFAADLRTLI
jgi:hypothetical protein